MCIDCGEVCEFGPNLELIRPSDGSLTEIDLDVLRVIRSILKEWKEHREQKSH